MNCIVLTPLKCTEKGRNAAWYIRKGRALSNKVILIGTFALIISDWNCHNDNFCVTSDHRAALLKSRYVIVSIIYSTVLMLVFPDITNGMIRTMINHNADVSNSPYRDICELARLHHWDGIADLIVYGVPKPPPNEKKSIQCYVNILCSKEESRETYAKHNLNRVSKRKSFLLRSWTTKNTKYTNGKVFQTLGFDSCKKMLLDIISSGYWDCKDLTFEKVNEFVRAMRNFRYNFRNETKLMIKGEKFQPPKARNNQSQKPEVVIEKQQENRKCQQCNPCSKSIDDLVTTTTEIWGNKTMAEMKEVFDTLFQMETIHTNLAMRKKHHLALSIQWNDQKKHLDFFVNLNIMMIDEILENLSKLTSNRFAYLYFPYFHQVVQQRGSELFAPEREKKKREEAEKKDQQVADTFNQDIQELQEAHKQGRVSAKLLASAQLQQAVQTTIAQQVQGSPQPPQTEEQKEEQEARDERSQFRTLWGVFQKVTISGLPGGEMTTNSLNKCRIKAEIIDILSQFDKYYEKLTTQQLEKMGLELNKLEALCKNRKGRSATIRSGNHLGDGNDDEDVDDSKLDNNSITRSATTMSDIPDAEKDGTVLSAPPVDEVSNPLVVIMIIGDYENDVMPSFQNADTDQARMMHTFGCGFNYSMVFQVEDQKTKEKKIIYLHHEDFEEINKQIENSTALDILTVLKKQYSFKMYWTWEDIDEFLKEVQAHVNDLNTPNYDGMITTITSHGESEVIITSDGDEFGYMGLYQPFNSKNCTKLLGKPKVWFMDMCRGTLKGFGIPLDLDDNKENDNVDAVDKFVHAYSNRRVIFTGPDGYSAIDGSYEGGYLIRGTADVFNEFAEEGGTIDLDETVMQIRRRMHKLAGTLLPQIGEDLNNMLHSVKLKKRTVK